MAHGRRGRRQSGAEKTEEPGLEEEDEDWSVIFRKCRDLMECLGNFQTMAQMKKCPKAKV
jgi:hypothetical protein